jgi:ankyrin repeat protein
VFAINFDEKMCGIPVFEPSWRDANAETAVLSACSTLVAIVDGGWRGKIVQFSHFSVQEYLISDRVANAEHVSHFHIHHKPAHTLLARSCLSFLLHLDYSIDEAKIKNFPLAEYASIHWVKHAQFEGVSSYIQDGMDLLFEKDKPHFATWIWVYDIDMGIYPPNREFRPEKLDRVPLYYAALCGFGSLVERLLTAHPQDLDAEGGRYGASLNVALAKGHLNIARFLLDHGAVGDTMGFRKQTALYIASSRGHADVVRSLIDRRADLNATSWDRKGFRGEVGWAPLHAAVDKNRRDIVLLLLEHGADPEIRSSGDETALYVASSGGCVDVVRQLVSHGADPNAECESLHAHGTPLHAASYHGRPEIARVLLEHGANPNAPDLSGGTALHLASEIPAIDLLLEHGVNVDIRDKEGWTPLHKAAYNLNLKVVVVLLDRGADPHAQTNKGETPFQLANAPPEWISKEDQAQIIQLLSERTGERI